MSFAGNGHSTPLNIKNEEVLGGYETELPTRQKRRAVWEDGRSIPQRLMCFCEGNES
jgi:hypothetical protein